MSGPEDQPPIFEDPHAQNDSPPLEIEVVQQYGESLGDDTHSIPADGGTTEAAPANQLTGERATVFRLAGGMMTELAAITDRGQGKFDRFQKYRETRHADNIRALSEGGRFRNTSGRGFSGGISPSILRAVANDAQRALGPNAAAQAPAEELPDQQ